MIIKKVRNVLSSSAPKSTILMDAAKSYIRAKRSGIYEEGFGEWAEFRAIVYELVKNDKYVTCNCRLDIKKQWCKHRIGLMIKYGLLSSVQTGQC
jgi:hypothetical protein